MPRMSSVWKGKKTRVQLELPEQELERFKKEVERFGFATYREYLLEMWSCYELLLEERVAGRFIASLDSEGKLHTRITTPGLARVKPPTNS